MNALTNRPFTHDGRGPSPIGLSAFENRTVLAEGPKWAQSTILLRPKLTAPRHSIRTAGSSPIDFLVDRLAPTNVVSGEGPFRSGNHAPQRERNGQRQRPQTEGDWKLVAWIGNHEWQLAHGDRRGHMQIQDAKHHHPQKRTANGSE
jgi:hypothetical protein